MSALFQKSLLLLKSPNQARNYGGGGGAVGGLPCSFLKIEKKSPDFGKEDTNCVHSCIESSIQNVVLRVSTVKSFKIFPCGAFFSWAFDEKFIKVP